VAYVNCLAYSDTMIFAGLHSEGVYLSTNFGKKLGYQEQWINEQASKCITLSMIIC